MPSESGSRVAVGTDAVRRHRFGARELLSPFGVLLLVYAYYLVFVYSGVHRYVYRELAGMLTRIIGYRPSGLLVAVYLFGAVVLLCGFAGGALLARRVDRRSAPPRPLAGVLSRVHEFLARVSASPLVSRIGLWFAISLLGWLVGFGTNALQVGLLGVASLSDIATRWQQSAVLVFVASSQIFFVPALVVAARKRWHFVVAAAAFGASTVTLALLGARNLPAKLVLAAFLAAVYRVPRRHLPKIVAVALIVFVVAFGTVGVLSKSGIYGPSASAGLGVALLWADSAGTMYNLDRIVHLTPSTGVYGGRLLRDSALALIPGVKADYANYQLGQYLGGRRYFVVNGQRIERSVSLSTSLVGAPYADWGVAGVVAQMLLLGLLFGYLQRRSRRALWIVPFLALWASYVINGVNAGVYNPHAIAVTVLSMGVMGADALTGHGEAGAGGRRLRLLFVSNMYPSPGNPVFGGFVQRQVEAMRRAGTSVRLVANTDARTTGAASVLKYTSLSVRAFLAGLERDFDAVVGHFLYPTADFARMAATLSGRPLVLVAHGTDVTSVQRDDTLARASRAALPTAALVVAVSHALESRLRDELALPAEVPTAVVNMGVDLTTFCPVADARDRLGWPKEERVALWVGNMVPVKGVPTLLEAFARVRRTGAADRLVLVGDGPLRRELEARAADLRIDHAVTFTGRLSQEDVAIAMAAADVFVLPSLNEGLSVALLEAMACGTPCVASAVGGVPEVLDDPACGRLVPPDDAEALAAGITEVLAAGKGAYYDAALSRARANGTDEMAARFLDAVGGVLDGGRHDQ